MSGNIVGGFFAVPAADGVDNINSRDVIGNRDDTHSTTTLTGYLHTLKEHAQGSVQCYPTQASPVTLSATASAWGDFTDITEIVPVSTINSNEFDIHWAVISGITANGDYELKLFKDAGNTEIAHVAFTRNAQHSQEGYIRITTALLDAETRISGSLSSSNAAADAANVKLIYQRYD